MVDHQSNAANSVPNNIRLLSSLMASNANRTNKIWVADHVVVVAEAVVVVVVAVVAAGRAGRFSPEQP